MTTLHDGLVARRRYFDGHSDTIGLFADPAFLRRAGAAPAEPFREAGAQKVAGIEARGFVLGDGVVDDWAETGSKALTTRRLIEECGGRYVGRSLLVDQLTDDVRGELDPVSTVDFPHELPG